MSRWYADTSAALKLIVEEPESAALARTIDHEQPELVGTLLLETELRRLVPRDAALSRSLVSELLDSVDLYEVSPSIFREAGLLPGVALRSLDALHLAAAVRLGVDAVLTYDHRMADSARDLGLAVLSPA